MSDIVKLRAAQRLEPMTLLEAINTVCLYLHRQHLVFVLYRAWEIAETHFRVAISQVQPENRQCCFDVALSDVPDCWNVTEVEIA